MLQPGGAGVNDGGGACQSTHTVDLGVEEPMAFHRTISVTGWCTTAA